MRHAQQEPLIDPAEMGQRARCGRCQGVGMLVEFRVIWKMPREGMPPANHWRRVADEEAGRECMVELQGTGATEIDLISGSHPCACRKPAGPPQPVGRPRGKSVRSFGNGRDPYDSNS